MAGIKLQKLPDQTPVKLTIFLPPDLHRALVQCARAYEQAFGEPEALTDLIPAMLSNFLQADRQFSRNRKPPNEAS